MVMLTLMQRAFGALNNMTNKTLGLGCKEKNPTCLEVECRTKYIMEATKMVDAQLHLNGCTHILPEGRLFLSGVARQEAGLLLKLLKPVSMSGGGEIKTCLILMWQTFLLCSEVLHIYMFKPPAPRPPPPVPHNLFS